MSSAFLYFGLYGLLFLRTILCQPQMEAVRRGMSKGRAEMLVNDERSIGPSR
jgi:hypothetical protein